MKKKKNKGARFLKRIVGFSIAFIVLFTIVSVYLNFRIGMELSPTLTTCVYAFFGTELASTALIRIFDKKDKEEEEARAKAEAQEAQEASKKTFYTDN